MTSVYILAWNEDGLGPNIETFYTQEKMVKRIGEILPDYGNPVGPLDDPSEVVNDYYDWVRLKCDNECEIDLTFEIVDV